MTDPATPQAPPATPADATRQPPEQYSRTHLDEIIRQNRLILAENESLRNQVASLQADRDTQHYSRQLSELATTRQLNQSAELERLMAMPTAEARDAHLGVIRDCYARTVVGADAGMNFSRPDPDTREGADRDVYQRDGSLTQAASDAVMAICGREGVSWDEGKAKYLSSRTTASA